MSHDHTARFAQRWKAAALLLAALSACALPPPAEDRPLVDPVEPVEPERRVDSSVGAPEPNGGEAREPDAAGDAASSEGDAAAVDSEAGAPSAGDQAADGPAAEVAAPSGPGSAAAPAGPGEEDSVADSAEGAQSDPPRGAETPAGESVAPSPEASTDGEPAAASSDSTAPAGGERAVSDDQTAAIEVGASESSPLERVDDATETVEEGPLVLPDEPAPGDGAGALREARLTRMVDGNAVEDVAYVVGGAPQAPRTVVFLHDWSGKAEQWSESLARYGADHRVLAIDFPGHGRSRGVARAVWDARSLGADVVEVLRAEDVVDAVLVGHGLGGQVALEVAARAPNRIDGVIGVDCLQSLRPTGPSAARAAYIEGFRSDFPKTIATFVQAVVGPNAPDGLVESLARDAQGADTEALLALLESFDAYDPRDATSSVRCPVVCINSEAQGTDVAGNRTLLSSFELRSLDGVGHWPHLEAPVRFQRELALLIDSMGDAREVLKGPLVRDVSPLLVVADLDAVARFYVEEIGFEVVRRIPAGDGPAERIVLVRDEATLTLWARAAFLEKGPKGAQVGPQAFALGVASVDRVRLRLSAELRERAEWSDGDGEPQLWLVDPAGNVVLFVESDIAR